MDKRKKPHTKEHIEKIRKSNIGLKRSIETRRKISECQKNKPRSEETKLKISNTLKGRHPVNEFKVGYKMSEESKKKLSIATKGKIISDKERERLLELRINAVIPKKDTSIEVKIQNLLKELKIGFFTHIYMDEILNAYQCDIFIPVQRNRNRFIKQPVIIECDGDYWHSYPIGREIDKIRTKQLEEKGFRVLRIWENEIKVMNLNDLKIKIGGNYARFP